MPPAEGFVPASVDNEILAPLVLCVAVVDVALPLVLRRKVEAMMVILFGRCSISIYVFLLGVE